MPQPLHDRIQSVAALLIDLDWKLVLAESCTAGLISASLGRIPGISDYLCGSAVVYRYDTKTQWLGVPPDVLLDPGPVSSPVARAMVEGVLEETPEADVAAAISGHLGPNAQAEQDGLIVVAVAIRGKSCQIVMHRLTDEQNFPGDNQREQRQWAATDFVLAQIAEVLRAEIMV